MSAHDLIFDAMGCEVRLIVGEPLPGSPPATFAAEQARHFIARFEAALSRFRRDSELTALNEDPRPEIPASELLRRAVRAGLWTAERTGGLVDPTLLDAIVAAGYAESRAGVDPVPLADALALAPERRPARPRAEAEWRLPQQISWNAVIQVPFAPETVASALSRLRIGVADFVAR